MLNAAKTTKIGIFDSGVGGLTVFKEIRKSFPYSDIVYFGDTARVPYGNKSRETIIEYSRQNANFLLDKGVNIIVVACNTSTAYALNVLQNMTQIPVIGVILSGAESAINATVIGRIGVIGTDGTINSHAYLNAIQAINSEIFVVEKSCPLFVPLAEEGWHDHQITKQVAEIYLAEILENNIDTLVLGCTHYPLLKTVIQEVCGDSIRLIDSAEAVVKKLEVETDMNKLGKNMFYVSDNEERFAHITRNILKIEDFSIVGNAFIRS